MILGGDFNASLYGMTDYFHVGESTPRPRTLVYTNDSLRARAFHTMVTTGLDGDEHVDECRHRTRALHKIQVVKSPRLVDTNGFHHDFEKIGNETCAGSGLRLVQDGSQSGACCPFVETENEIHEKEWCEPAWLGARRLMAQSGCRDTDGMGQLECDGASAVGNGEGSQKAGNHRDVGDRIGAQIASAEKEENRTTPRSNRVELALSRNLEEAESAEARETPGKDQGECRVGESHQENTKQAFQLKLDCKTRKPRICSHKLLPRPLLDFGRPGRRQPNPRDDTG